MRNILLVGGMGAGKTTLANHLLAAVPDLVLLYTGRRAIMAGATLRRRLPGLLDLDRDAYIAAVNAVSDDEIITTGRDENIEYSRLINSVFGPTIIADTLIASLLPDRFYLVDNILGLPNVLQLRMAGFAVVGLTCALATQVERRAADARAGDAVMRDELVAQTLRSNEAFDVSACLEAADEIFDTDLLSPKAIAHALLGTL